MCWHIPLQNIIFIQHSLKVYVQWTLFCFTFRAPITRNMTSLQCRQRTTFAITWVVYASSYMLRKPLGVIKSDLQTNYHLTKNQLGWLDTSFFLPYALVQILMGNLGDKYGCARVITINMIIIGGSTVSFIHIIFKSFNTSHFWPDQFN